MWSWTLISPGEATPSAQVIRVAVSNPGLALQSHPEQVIVPVASMSRWPSR